MMILFIIAIALGVLMVIQSLRSKTAEDFSNVYVGLAVIVASLVAWASHASFSFGLNLATVLFIATGIAFIGVFFSGGLIVRVAFFILLGLFAWLGLGATAWVFIVAIIAAVLMALYFAGVLYTGLLMILAMLVASLLAAASINPMTVAAVSEDTSSQDTGSASLDLTVKPGELIPARAKCTDDTFNRNSQAGTEGRVWTDSVSTPFSADEKGEQLSELIAEICTNPTLGDAYAQALSQGKIGDFAIEDANPWLTTFMQTTEKSGMQVWLTHKQENGEFVTDSNGAKVIYVTKDYQANAERVNTILLVLDNQGVKKGHTSTTHWPSMPLIAGAIPRAYAVTDKDKQENEPFLALTFTAKAGENCPFVLGVNIKDKRPEYVECKAAKKIAPKQPTKSKSPEQPKVTPSTPATTTEKAPPTTVTTTEVTKPPTVITKTKTPKTEKTPKTKTSEPAKPSEPTKSKPPTASKTPSPTPSTESPKTSETPSDEPTPETPKESEPPTESETPSETPTESETPSTTPSESEKPSETPSPTPTTESPKFTPTPVTPTLMPTPTKTEKPKPTPTKTKTPEPTPTKTKTPKPTPTKTEKPKPTPTPKTCVWKNGSVHELTKDGLCPKDPTVIPENKDHVPNNTLPSQKAEEKPVQQTKKATPTPKATKKPDAPKTYPTSTQKAPGASEAPKATAKQTEKPKDNGPKPSEPEQSKETSKAEEVKNEPSAPAEACTDPDTGEAC